MNSTLDEDLLQEARVYYHKRNFRMLEPILQQFFVQNSRSPELYHMQANVFLNKGQFTKAINSFKQALEQDPTYIEASVGLSVLLNDLGKYDEAKLVYQQAEKYVDRQKEQVDPSINERLATKHEEIADLYIQSRKFNEAIEQLHFAQNLSQRKAEISLRIADLYAKIGQDSRAIKELKSLLGLHPHFVAARLRLGLILYGLNKLEEAIEQWESALLRDSQNQEAQKYIRMARAASGKKIDY
ncbi:MAG: tetratricopeptide repeat protein [Bdellovibrionaceae bacterium]|nr:tetratricopeptide repeat protein [Pseudobdellovibrionaceae bacterium]